VVLVLAWYRLEQLLARTQYLLFDILSQVSIRYQANGTISVPAVHHTPHTATTTQRHTTHRPLSVLFTLWLCTLSTHTCRATWTRFLPRLLPVCVHSYIPSFLFVSSTCCFIRHDPPCSTRIPPTRRVVDTQTPRRPRGLVLLVLLRRSQLLNISIYRSFSSYRTR